MNLELALLFDLSHSVSMFRGHISGLLTAFFTVTDCRPDAQPQPQGPVHRIYNPWGRVTQLYPRHGVPIFVDFYDFDGLQWGYCLPRSPNGQDPHKLN
jgi:hypothetical protein